MLVGACCLGRLLCRHVTAEEKTNNLGVDVEAASCSIEDLPDQLLGHILALAGREQRVFVTLVSKRWRRVFYAERELWRSLTLSPGMIAPIFNQQLDAEILSWWFSCHLGLLRRVHGSVQALRIGGLGDILTAARTIGQPSRVAALLRALCPPALRELRLSCEYLAGPDFQLHSHPSLSAGIMRVLPRFNQLQVLEIDSWQLPPGFINLLLQLTDLRALRCRTRELPLGTIPAVVVQLEQLTRLQLLSTLRLPDVRCLTMLHLLRHLELTQENPTYASLDAPSVTCLPHLTHLYMKNARRPMMVGAQQLASCRLRLTPADPDSGISSNSGASGSSNGGSGSSNGASGSSNGASGSSNGKSEGDSSSCSNRGRARLKLRFCRVHDDTTSLVGLLDALVPAGAALEQLEMSMCGHGMDAAALDNCARHLSSLTSLNIQGWHVSDNEAPLAAMLHHATQLRHLEVPYMYLQPLPNCLATYQGLTSLSLEHSLLTDLPPAPFILGLRELRLGCNQLARLPLALLVATSLTRLELYGNRGLALTRLDVDILLALPQLRHLDVRGIKVWPADMVRLSRGAPLLEILADSGESKWLYSDDEFSGGSDDDDEEDGDEEEQEGGGGEQEAPDGEAADGDGHEDSSDDEGEWVEAGSSDEELWA